MHYIIGSSASAVAAASALLDRGVKVTILDVGFELEPERAAVVSRLAALPKEKWNQASVRVLRENILARVSGVADKCVYGSDYPFRGKDISPSVACQGAKMYRSLARGGLTNIWGGSILPFRSQDMRDWPFMIDMLEPHYRSVLDLIEHAMQGEDLSDLYPRYNGRVRPFKLSGQALAFLNDLESNKRALAQNGIQFGRSRLAVRFPENAGGVGCSYCGMCLYGCPYDHIYSARQTLDKLIGRPGFQYHQGILVERVEEGDGGVRIHARALTDGSRTQFKGSRCLLAAGVVSTTAILLASIEAYDRVVSIRHSDHFQLPMLRYASTRGVMEEELHTLTQLYLEIEDTAISENTIHLQVYTYNDLYLVAMKSLFGPLAGILRGPIRSMLERLIFVQGFLHSDQSSHIEVVLNRNDGLHLHGFRNPAAKRAMRQVVRKIFRDRSRLRALPLAPLASVSVPGGGNHSGGTFPMRAKPHGFETDVLGIPCGFSRVHAIDSTVFPNIAASTMLLTVMANAHRIASSIE